MTNLEILTGAVLSAESGTLYRDFDEDSVLEFLYEYGFMPINTYASWKKLGYQVQKGEKKKMSVPLWVKNKKYKNPTDTDDIDPNADGTKRREFFSKMSYLFDFSQVAKIKQDIENIDIPVLDDMPEELDCENLEVEKGAEEISAPENEVQDVVNDENNKMQFNYSPVEEEKTIYNEDLPKTCRTALNKYVKNLTSDKNDRGIITKQINIDEEHGTFIINGFTAIYMDFDKYIVPMPKAEEPMNHGGFFPKYEKISWSVLSIKDLKDAFKGYKKTTGNKMGYFRIYKTVLDAKILLDAVTIIDNKAFTIECSDNPRNIAVLTGGYGKAIICPVNPNGIDETMIIGSIE